MTTNIDNIFEALERLDKLAEAVENLGIMAGDVKNFEIRPNLMEELETAETSLKKAKEGLHATLHGFIRHSPAFFVELFQANDLAGHDEEVLAKINALSLLLKKQHTLEETVKAYSEVWQAFEAAGVKNLPHNNSSSNGQKPTGNGKTAKPPLASVQKVTAPASAPPAKYPGVMAAALENAGVKAE